MTTEPIYRNPGFWKKAVYFLMLFLVAQFFARLLIGVVGMEMGFCYRMRLDLDEKLGQFKVMVWNTLFQRLDAPAEALANLPNFSRRQAFEDIAASYPEVLAFYSWKDGKLTNLYLRPENSPPLDRLTSAVAAVIDTITPYHGGKQSLKVENMDLLLALKFLPQEKRIVVSAADYYKYFLPQILQEGVKIDPVLYNKIFGRYPVEFYSAEFFDYSDSLFYTFGKKRKMAWSEDKPWDMIFLPWKVKFNYYPDHESEIRYAEKAGKIPWFIISEFVVTLILLILLVHFSPYLHGYSKGKKE